MITGVHTMFYSSEPEKLRDFIRDKLGFSYTDVGEGWLIFNLPEADMGCHPADAADGKPSGTHDISFYCDDITETVSQLKQADLFGHSWFVATHTEDLSAEEIEERARHAFA